MAATKVSITLPEEVFRAVEARREASHETRSDFFRRAAERLLGQEPRADAVARYVCGYEKHPETAEEDAWADVGASLLAEVPWPARRSPRP